MPSAVQPPSVGGKLSYDEAVRSIYAAGHKPEPWPAIVNCLAEVTGVAEVRAIIRRASGVVLGWSSAGQDGAIIADVPAWLANDPFSDRPLPVAAVTSADPARAHLPSSFGAQPAGVLGVDLLRSGAASVRLRLFRPGPDANFSGREQRLLNALAGHITAALDLRDQTETSRLQARIYESVMEYVHIGLVIVDGERAITYSNKAAQALLESKDGVHSVNGRLEASYAADTRELQELIGAALAQPGIPFGRALPRPSAQRDLITICRSASGLIGKAHEFPNYVAVFLRDMEARSAMSADVLCRVYGLTATEVRLSTELARGCSMEDAAKRLGVRLTTARAHLRSIFSKTGVTRQSELIRLLLI